MISGRSHWAAALAAALFLPASLSATSIDVNPVRIDLAGGGQATELRLTNTGDGAVSLQVDTLKWEQDSAAADNLTETDLLLAVPPIFTIQPGNQQIVRLAYLGQQDAELEQSFRLLLTELAPPVSSDKTSSGLKMRMRFSIPAFVAPQAGEARGELVLIATDLIDDAVAVTVENAGTAHLRIAGVEVFGRDGWVEVDTPSGVRYLLPGVSARVEIAELPDRFSRVRFKSIDGRHWEYAVGDPR